MILYSIASLILSTIVIIILGIMSYCDRGIKYGANENTGDLEYEYRRYLYITRILNCIQGPLGCKGHTAKDIKNINYEVRNIVERWLLSIVNFSNDPFDPIFSNDVLSADCRFNTQMAQELIDKTPYTSAEINELIANIIDIVHEYKNIMKQPCVDATFTIRGDTFIYRDYKRKIAPERLTLLLERGNSYQVARMLLRYASILPGAQHWNMPKDNFQAYYDRGITIEGFASPINAQLITIDPSCQFCSLFPDVDRPFGSIGNFFQVDFVGKKVAVGPPYTVELFDKIAKKIESQCTAAENSGQNILFFITFAAWEDTDGFKQLRDSKWCKFSAILPRLQHFYVNTNKPNQPKVIARFNTVFFDINVGFQSDYSGLFDGMSHGMKLKILRD